MIRPNGRNCCRGWPMGRRPAGASESLWTVCSLGGQASGFGRNQAPKTDRLNQVPSWEFRNRLKSFTPRQLARILWDPAYLCLANTSLSAKFARQISLAFYLAHAKMRPVQNLIEAQTPIVT